jgi:ACS family pantothenate transporter-like MFS transporter
MAFVWGWLSDGPFRGARYPFIYAGAVLTVSSKPFVIYYSLRPLADNSSAIKLIFTILMRQMPLYEHIYQRKVVYWLSQIGVSPSSPTEKSCLADLDPSSAPVHSS